MMKAGQHIRTMRAMIERVAETWAPGCELRKDLEAIVAWSKSPEADAGQDVAPCRKAPPGWLCTRGEHPDGPCAAIRTARVGDPTVRHVVEWMRATFPLNQHARSWALEIEGVFLGAGANPPPLDPEEALAGTVKAALLEVGVAIGDPFETSPLVQAIVRLVRSEQGVPKSCAPADRPTYNHSREDGPYDPCPECLDMMGRKELRALVADLRNVLAETNAQLEGSRENFGLLQEVLVEKDAIVLDVLKKRDDAMAAAERSKAEVRESAATYLRHVADCRLGIIPLDGYSWREVVGLCASWVANGLDAEWAKDVAKAREAAIAVIRRTKDSPTE